MSPLGLFLSRAVRQNGAKKGLVSRNKSTRDKMVEVPEQMQSQDLVMTIDAQNTQGGRLQDEPGQVEAKAQQKVKNIEGSISVSNQSTSDVAMPFEQFGIKDSAEERLEEQLKDRNAEIIQKDAELEELNHRLRKQTKDYRSEKAQDDSRQMQQNRERVRLEYQLSCSAQNFQRLTRELNQKTGDLNQMAISFEEVSKNLQEEIKRGRENIRHTEEWNKKIRSLELKRDLERIEFEARLNRMTKDLEDNQRKLREDLEDRQLLEQEMTYLRVKDQKYKALVEESQTFDMERLAQSDYIGELNEMVRSFEDYIDSEKCKLEAVTATLTRTTTELQAEKMMLRHELEERQLLEQEITHLRVKDQKYKALVEESQTFNMERLEHRDLVRELNERIQSLEIKMGRETSKLEERTLTLNRTTVDLQVEKRKVRQALEDNEDKNRQLEFVQQRCALLRERITLLEKETEKEVEKNEEFISSSFPAGEYQLETPWWDDQ